MQKALIVYQAPWDWGFLWNRAQPLATALAERCEVIYLNQGIAGVGGMVGRLRRLVTRLPRSMRTLALQWHRNVVSKVSDSLSVWSWEGLRSEPWLLTCSDRPATHYRRLKEHIRRRAESGSEVWLVTSRPQAAGLTNLWQWDRLVVDIEDPWFDLGWGGRVNRDVVLDALKKADAVFANGELIAREYGRLSGRAVVSLPNGVDERFLDALKVAGARPGFFTCAPGSLRAVFTGNINDRIDYSILAEVVQAPGYHFYFIGQDNVPGKSQPQWEAIKGRKNVTWVPALPHHEIPAVLQHAHVLLLPYFRTGHEKMFPAKLFEYAAAAKPIITTIDFTAGAFAIPTLAVCGDTASFVREMERLRAAGASVSPVVAAECRALVRQNTWETRASELLRQAGGGDLGNVIA